MMPSPQALKEAQTKLDEDPKVDQVMILPARMSLRASIPRVEGATAIVRDCGLGRDDWYILTRDEVKQ